MDKAYVDQRDGGYWVKGTRVSLDSVILAFLRGASPEAIAQSFPTLTLEEVYGAITHYLGHQAEIDSYLAQKDQEFEALRVRARKEHPALYRKLEEARHRLPSRQQ